jgi:ParE-like toxin of type II ParDE toxin-antitoxin system
MAQVVWTEPALADLDAIADYIALDNPEAARLLVKGSSSMSNNWNGIPRADPSQPSSVVLDTGKLSSRPAGSFIALTVSGFGSST